jgi:hypothetical protein
MPTMDTLILILVPFGGLAVLAGFGAASAGLKAAAAGDARRRFELWGLCAVLAVYAVLLAGAAWWWWAGWSNFSF